MHLLKAILIFPVICLIFFLTGWFKRPHIRSKIEIIYKSWDGRCYGGLSDFEELVGGQSQEMIGFVLGRIIRI